MIVSGEIPHYKLNRSDLESGINIIDLISDKTGILSSKSEARRALTGNAISVNKIKQNDLNALIHKEMLLKNRFVMIENGKKNKTMIEFV